MKPENKPLFIFFLLLAAQQAFFLIFFRPFLEPDSYGYMSVASQALASGDFSSNTRVPGYPAFLSFFYLLFGQNNFIVIVFQHLLGLLLWFIFVRLLDTDRQKMIFSALYFCDLLFNSYQHAVLTDFLFSFLICLSAWLVWLYRRDGKPVLLLLCGLLVGLAILTKPVLKLFPFFILPVFLAGRRPLRSRLASAAVFLSLPLLALNLWSYRNYRVHGSFGLLTAESYHYISRVINHIEFPPGSVIKDACLKHLPEGRVPRDRKSAVLLAVIADMKAAGLDLDELDPEFKKVVSLSIYRHPFIFLKESAVEVFYFFFSAHNLYARAALKDRLPVSAEEGLRSGRLGATLLKIAVSMHPFYWAVFCLFLGFTALNAGRAVRERDYFLLYSYGLIVYITLVSCMANEGLARYRVAIQPFMLLFSAIAVERLCGARGTRGEKRGP